MNTLAQIAIAVTGVIAIWLTQSPNFEQRRWACLFGLCGQPFWMYAAWTGEQYGIFILTFFYTLSWARGVKTNWFTKPGPA